MSYTQTYPMRLHPKAHHAPIANDDTTETIHKALLADGPTDTAIGHAALLDFDRTTILLTCGFND